MPLKLPPSDCALPPLSPPLPLGIRRDKTGKRICAIDAWRSRSGGGGAPVALEVKASAAVPAKARRARFSARFSARPTIRPRISVSRARASSAARRSSPCRPTMSVNTWSKFGSRSGAAGTHAAGPTVPCSANCVPGPTVPRTANCAPAPSRPAVTASPASPRPAVTASRASSPPCGSACCRAHCEGCGGGMAATRAAVRPGPPEGRE